MSGFRPLSIITLAVGLFLAAITAEAQPAKVPRIGFLGTATASLMSVWLTAFREGLRERGWVDGQNLAIEYRWGEGKPERFPGLAAELVGLPVDVIVTSGSQAVRAAQQASDTVPIIMAVIQEPVGLGLVQSLARPGGNTTRPLGPEPCAMPMAPGLWSWSRRLIS
jgi:putative ABC transport system substrate-binding protein